MSTPAEPGQLAIDQSGDALEWLSVARAGVGLHWHWQTLRDLLGPMLPGWLVCVGARPECGKTTLLLTQALSWATQGRSVMVIGTETGPEILRLQLAALYLGFPVGPAITGAVSDEEHDRLCLAVRELAQDWGDTLMVAGSPEARRLEDVLFWVDYAADHGAQIVIFDHLHEITLSGSKDHTNDLGEAVKQLRKAAVERNVLFVLAAQFNRGHNADPLALHEVPHDGMWRGTDVIQQASVVALQLYKPLRPGVTAEQKRAFREQRPAKNGLTVPTIGDLVQTGVMGIRVAKHRYRSAQASGKIVKLGVEGDVIRDLPP